MNRMRGLIILLVLVSALAVGLGASAQPSILPTGPKGRIAFASDRPNGKLKDAEIYVMNADGTDLTRLTHFSKFPGFPTWSPDGQRIAFGGIGVQFTSPGSHQIYVMNADGSDLRSITDGPLFSEHPYWSPDGSSIAFDTRPPPTGQPQPGWIMVMNADGTGVTQLTSGADLDERPTWAPDGSRIAFERDFHDGTTAIFVINRDGSGLKRILDGVCCMDPAWSPDGRTISFWNSPAGLLQTVNVRSGSVSTLATAEHLGGASTSDLVTSWSPDGRWLASGGFFDEGSRDLYLIATDGSGTTIKVPNGQFAMAPAWEPTSSS